jgi:GDPmannose 4,6-dehydratase
MSRKRAFIFGINGQDGYYLAKLLLEKNYKVFGSFKNSNLEKQAQFDELGVETTYCDIRDEDRVQFLLMNFSPHEVYNLAAESSVIDSWINPTSCLHTNSFGVLNILNVLVNQKNNLADTRFFQASSSEMFGDTGLLPATEESPMLPRSPYAVSKLLSHQLINIYRQKYKCFATSGILFNHESPLRSEKFLSKKTSGVVKILKGLSDEICLGNMEIRRDWSFAAILSTQFGQPCS